MPGPKYVTDFEFPQSAGFTGSRNDRVAVRPHVRRYAEGGHVKSDEKLTPKPPQDTNKGAQKTPTPRSDTVQAKPGSMSDALSGRSRKQQEKDLGLKRGGRVTKSAGGSKDAQGTLAKLPRGGSGGAKFSRGGSDRRYAEGGIILGNSAVKRDLSTTQEDLDNGGKTPLRDGFARGGTIKPRVTVGTAAARGANLKKMNRAATGGPVKLAAGGLSTDARDTGKMGMTKIRKMKSTEPIKRGVGGSITGRGPIRPNFPIAPAVMPTGGRRSLQPMPTRGGPLMMRAKGGSVKMRTAADKDLGIARAMPKSAPAGGPGKGKATCNY